MIYGLIILIFLLAFLGYLYYQSRKEYLDYWGWYLQYLEENPGSVSINEILSEERRPTNVFVEYSDDKKIEKITIIFSENLKKNS